MLTGTSLSLLLSTALTGNAGLQSNTFGQGRKQIFVCQLHRGCAYFKNDSFNPTEQAAGTFGTQLKWSGGGLEKGIQEEVRGCIPMSQNPTEQKAPHMFCPSRQDFYSRLSVINVLDSFISGNRLLSKIILQEAAVPTQD